MKKKIPIRYDYYVHSISEDDTSAYEAIIPAFDNAVVFGDSLEELEEGIRFAISSEIAERKKLNKPIPEPDKQKKFSGKVLIRITPFLHEQLTLQAKAGKKTLNKYITEQLRK